MLTDEEREALVRSLRDAADRIASGAVLVKMRETDRDTVRLLEGAVLDIDRAIHRLTRRGAQSA